MKYALIFIAAIFTSYQSLADIKEGEYQSNGKRLNILIASPSEATVSLLVNTSKCSGWVTSKAKIAGDKISLSTDYCSLTITNNNGLVSVKENQCLPHHEAGCDFGGEYKFQGKARQETEDYYSLMAVTAMVDRLEKSNSTSSNDYPTKIESSPPGARIILNGEYLGQAPLSVNIRPYLIKDRIITNKLKAIPRGIGCTSIEIIRNIESPPKRMFFDTSMCPVNNDINIYNN